MGRRAIIIYGTCFVLLTSLVLRLYELSRGELLASTSINQSTYTLEVAKTRGIIYDCNFSPMVGQDSQSLMAVVPGPDTASHLLPQLIAQERENVLAMLQQGKPFLYSPTNELVSGVGVWQFELAQRYSAEQLAVHVVGYTEKSSGQGVVGIEAAYDQLLQDCGGEISVSCQVDAAGRALSVGEVEGQEAEMPKGGVVLSINSEIQRIAEQALLQNEVQKGAVVVMDIHSGEIKAMVSLPTYDPGDVASSLENKDSPMLNRALVPYSVGSTFKLVVAASALEQGIPAQTSYECEGYVEVDGHTFWCNNRTGHGNIDMHEAVAQSCNSYFINLTREMDTQHLHNMAKQLGFGRSVTLADGLVGSAGTLTSVQELTSGELANFSFGQGKLSATPLQIATMISAIANGGQMVFPQLVVGTTKDGQQLATIEEGYADQRVMSEESAELIRRVMILAVREGSATMARPELWGAGGKTGSAQTGVTEDGQEIVHAWFAGFYPQNNPEWSIVVFCEDGQSGSRVAAPVFADIAQGINGLGTRGFDRIP